MSINEHQVTKRYGGFFDMVVFDEILSPVLAGFAALVSKTTLVLAHLESDSHGTALIGVRNILDHTSVSKTTHQFLPGLLFNPVWDEECDAERVRPFCIGQQEREALLRPGTDILAEDIDRFAARQGF